MQALNAYLNALETHPALRAAAAAADGDIDTLLALAAAAGCALDAAALRDALDAPAGVALAHPAVYLA